MIDQERLEEVAREARDEVGTAENGSWPDCFEVSSELQKRLINDEGLDASAVLIKTEENTRA